MKKNDKKTEAKNETAKIRTSEREDYKLQPSVGLDITAAVVSGVIAVLIWLLS